MAGAFCQGRALSQVLRIASASTIPRCLPRSQIWRPLHRYGSLWSPRRAFSIVPVSRHQAVQAQDESQANGAPPQLSKFQDLADYDLVNRTVINTIVNGMGIHTMTDVQRMTINECLDGADIIAQAKTGTGKTLAFLMPIVQRILRDPNLERRSRQRANPDDIRALIISPTRELAEQIAVEAKKIVRGTAVKVQTAVGGSQKSYHLRLMQQEGCHILVGTPGRVKDILSDGYSGVKLDNIDAFVLDEADRLLDIGFAPDIAEIQTYMPPREERHRQTLMFSATVPKEVVSLVRQTLRPDFKFIRTVAPDETPVHEKVPQHVTFLRGLENQMPALFELSKRAIDAHKNDPENNLPFKAIVYFNSKSEVALAQEVFQNMRGSDGVDSPRSMFSSHPLDPCYIVEMHSGLNQGQRTRNSEVFRRAESAILLSSDVTARGMDFPNVSHVIQIGLPRSAEDYVHRIGRTGRAGKSGQGWLLLQEDEQIPYRRMLGRGELNISTDTSIQTAQVDMGRSAQLPASVANTLQTVESGVKSTPMSLKHQAYTSMLGALNGSRDKQSVVDLLNELARNGWGMDRPPPVSPSFVGKLGYNHTQGLNVSSERPFFGDQRGGFGGDRRGSFGSDRRGSFGSDRRGSFGSDRRSSFGRDRRSGSFSDRSGGRDGLNNRDPFGDDGQQQGGSWGRSQSQGADAFGGGRRFNDRDGLGGGSRREFSPRL